MQFQFNDHRRLSGLHAAFSPSQSSWLRYDDDRAVEVYMNRKAAEMGTRLHEWAKQTIDLGIKQPRSNKTIYKYVNDAIGFRMNTEVVLYYSERFFGTADAIAFDGKLLRIHDLKTGVSPVRMDQLRIYAALFCLEYRVRPGEIDFELRIYQNDDIEYDHPTAEDIAFVMDKIVSLDNLFSKLNIEEV